MLAEPTFFGSLLAPVNARRGDELYPQISGRTSVGVQRATLARVNDALLRLFHNELGGLAHDEAFEVVHGNDLCMLLFDALESVDPSLLSLLLFRNCIQEETVETIKEVAHDVADWHLFQQALCVITFK